MPQRKWATLESDLKDRPVCSNCKKLGHVIADCFALKRKNAKSFKPVALANTPVVTLPLSKGMAAQPRAEDVLDEYRPFVMDGWVSIHTDCDAHVLVRMLRDTGAAQSFVLDSVLPFSENTAIGSNVLIQGVEMGCISVPLHSIKLDSPLVSGQVVVGIRPSLPVEGISFILGNDLAGGKVPVHPQVTPIPRYVEGPDVSEISRCVSRLRCYKGYV